MARAIWSGSISFGLLNVPVKLYSAVSKKSVSFRELRESDGSRVRHKRVAEADGKEVEYNDIVKGYEIAPEQYVVDHPRRARGARPEEDAGDRDPGLRRPRRHRPDLLRPSLLPRPRQGCRARLRAAGQGDGRGAQGRRRALRAAQQARASRRCAPMDGVLTMATMRFADEVVSPTEISRGARRGRRDPAEEGARHGQGADRLADVRFRRRASTRTSTARSCWR